jgi:hypothetical protein
MTRSRALALWSVLGACVLLALLAAGARADIAGAGPDETIQQAYGPLSPSVTYSGAFSNPDDVDYLAVKVTTAGQSFHFTVSNTTPSCVSPDDDYCPVYATLMDQQNQQVGGDNSDAGTIATVADSETIDWTFAQPGTYYVLMESNGNLAPGEPRYTVSFTTSGGSGMGGGGSSGTGGGGSSGTGGGGSSSTGGSGSTVKVARHQRGPTVVASVTLASAAARLEASLYALRGSHRRRFTHTSRRHLAAGQHRLALRLPARYRRELRYRHHLSLLVRITVLSDAGVRQTYSAPVTLTS